MLAHIQSETPTRCCPYDRILSLNIREYLIMRAYPTVLESQLWDRRARFAITKDMHQDTCEISVDNFNSLEQFSILDL